MLVLTKVVAAQITGPERQIQPESVQLIVSFCDQIVACFQICEKPRMNKAIVESKEPLTLVGGGTLFKGDLEAALALAPRLVAADGGAGAALAAGYMPEAVIGDFDSLTPGMRAQLPEASLHPIPEQDSTDFGKALRSISAPLVLGAGFLGDRVDHQLAAFNVLVQPGRCPCIILGATEVIFHLHRETRLPVEAGDLVSLFPMQPVTARSEGLDWPLEGLKMSPAGQIGTSNRALGPAVVRPDGPGLL